jgi:hypothetical protein
MYKAAAVEKIKQKYHKKKGRKWKENFQHESFNYE